MGTWARSAGLELEGHVPSDEEFRRYVTGHILLNRQSLTRIVNQICAIGCTNSHRWAGSLVPRLAARQLSAQR